MVDIQRETDMGGAIHSKGVLILTSFLAARYSSRRPLSMSASLVFEQSYGPVDGDSATIAEICALLSSLAATPIRQSLAVTGSMNQLGEVQAIGGVNEKDRRLLRRVSRPRPHRRAGRDHSGRQCRAPDARRRGGRCRARRQVQRLGGLAHRRVRWNS
ncbi:MAG: S16 family serine protease [Burkholderiaceae bacterium]